MHFRIPQLDCAAVHRQALEILDKIGIEISRPEHHVWVMKTISGEAGVFEKGGRICFKRDYVETEIAALRKKRTLSTAERVFLGCVVPEQGRSTLCVAQCGNAPIYDSRSGEHRPLDRRMAAEMIRFADSLYTEGVRWRGCYEVHDVPESLRQLTAAKMDFELSRERYPQGTALQSERTVDYFLEMWQAAGRHYIHGIWPIEPLRIGGECFDVIPRLLTKQVSFYVCTYGLAGLNAPVGLEESFAQCVASAIGGYLLLNRLTEGRTLGFKVWALPGVPVERTGPKALESAWKIAEYQVNAYYGMREPVLYWTDEPLLLMLAGCRILSGVGRIGGIEGGLSAYKILEDLCRVRHIEKNFAVFDYTAGQDTAGIIDAAIREGGTFVQLEDTALNWRDFYDFSGEILPVCSEEKNLPYEMLQKRVQRNDYQADTDFRRELDRIYQSAIRNLDLNYSPQEYYGGNF